MFVTVFHSSVFATETPVFTGEAAKIQTQLASLFDSSKKVNDLAPATRKAARDAIENSMDWEQVAKDCLGNKEWSKNSAANRSAYRDLLREVVVKTAFTRLDTFWDGATYKFTKIDVSGDKAQVVAKYTVKGDTLTLDYFLTKKADAWRIYDIAFEDLRYSENIREQITAFLKGKGFSNLLAKLKQRRDELNETKDVPAPKAEPAPMKKKS